MEYPRRIVLDDPKLKKLLLEKEDLILEGREASARIEELEEQMAIKDTEIQALEKKIDLGDLRERAEDITKRFNAVAAEMAAMKKEIYERMNAEMPKEVLKEYDDMKKEKERLEKHRNKLALKVQARSDRVIPMARKLLEPYLRNEYEDYDSLRIENGEVVGTIFSHLEEFKTRHLEKIKK
jgi:hypothetical protein